MFRRQLVTRDFRSCTRAASKILKELQGDLRHLAVLEKGDFFGDLRAGRPSAHRLGARADRLLAAAHQRATFDQMLRANPDIAVRMMRKLSRRLRETINC